MTTSYTAKAFTGTLPTGSFLFQAANGDKSTKIVKGEVYTFNFLPNIYWTDGVQMNALDYNYSLWQYDLAGSSLLPDSATPGTGELTGPTGLIASYVPPGQGSEPLTIQVYINSSSVWNLLLLQISILPAHIFSHYFNNDLFSSSTTLDTALNAKAAIALDPINKTGLPAWLMAEPNLEVGTGPFILNYPRTSTEETTSTGLIVANPNYYRENWQMYTWNSSNIVSKGDSFTESFPIYLWTYSTTACASAVDNVCKVPMSTANVDGGKITGTWSIVKGTSDTAPYTVVSSGPLTCGAANGDCTATLPTGTAGTFHVIIQVQYSYLGLSRTWYQSWGYKVK